MKIEVTVNIKGLIRKLIDMKKEDVETHEIIIKKYPLNCRETRQYRIERTK